MEFSAGKKEDRNRIEYEMHAQSRLPSTSEYIKNSNHEGEVNLLDYWRVLQKRKWLIILVTLICLGLSILASFLMPKKYKSQATLMVLTASGSGGLSGLANQLSSIPIVGNQIGGLGGIGGGKTKELVNILKSRTLSEKIVDKYDLMKIFFKKQWNSQTQTFMPNWMGVIPVKEDAVNHFQKKISNIEEDKKTGLIKIEIKMTNPVLAENIANEMILDLQDFLETNSLTISKRNRIFIEEQLVKNGAKLLEAGKELSDFYATNKISSVVPQIDVDVGSYQLVPKPFEDFKKEFNSISNQQNETEKKKERAVVLKVPGQIYLQYLILNRELITKAHALLTQQYEMAKIDEAKEDLAFQVIDRADLKVRPSSPILVLNIAIGIVGGIFFGIFLAFFREYIQQLKAKESHK